MAAEPSPDNPIDPISIGFPEPITLPESMSPRKPGDDSRQSSSDPLALCSVGAHLNAILEWEALLQETLETATRLVRADGASLMLVDEHDDELYIAAARNLPNAVIKATRVKIGDGIVGRVAQSREPVLLIGRVRAEQYPNSFPKPKVVASSLCVPLLAPSAAAQTQNLIGVLTLSRKPGTPTLTQDDLKMVRALCVQAAVAVQNARLYQRMHRRAVQLQHLIEISNNMIATLDVDVVLRLIMDKAVELLGCLAGSVLLVDQETQELVFKVAVGPASDKLIDTRLPPGAGIAGTVARDAKPLIVNNAQADPRHYREVDHSTAMTTQSLLCVPLVSKGRTIGVVEVMNKIEGTPFDEEDLQSLAAFSIQGAIALENAQLYSDLRRSFADTVRIITRAVEARDPYTAGHTSRVTQIALETARELGWSRERLEILEIGALLHDIGKIGVRDRILHKAGDLTEDEYTEMQYHPIIGAQMLEGVSALRPMLPYILYHQERYDGKGYPFGLAAKEIPMEGRVLAVADTLDAMTSSRPYRQEGSVESAVAEIVRNRGTQFDPDVVDALMRAMQKGKIRFERTNEPPENASSHMSVGAPSASEDRGHRDK